LLWAAVDSPWVQTVDPSKYRATIDPLRQFDPSMMLSTHLPPASGVNGVLFDMLHEAPDAPAFVGPDQEALEAMLASFEPRHHRRLHPFPADVGDNKTASSLVAAEWRIQP
jgi:hypothetical protein